MIDATARIAEGLGLPESVVQALGAAGWTLVAERNQPVKWVAPPGLLMEPMIVVPQMDLSGSRRAAGWAMSVADEAKAAAEAEYPAEVTSIAVADSIARMRQVPFAHGYQRGYAAGRMTIVDTLERFVDGHWEKWDGTVEPGVRYQFRTKRTRS